jgi:hypothetical protein
VGELLIAWTARFTVGCFLLRLLLILRRPGRIPYQTEIAVWAAGWLLLLTHTACAFQFQHHWSQAAAYAHTARRTLDMAGWNWGGGLYFNYLTVVLWGLDVLVLRRASQHQVAPPRWWTWLVIGWIGFVTLNATLVFGPRWWWGIGTLFLVAITIVQRSMRESG